VALEPVPAMPPLVLIAHDDPTTADSLRHAVETAVGWQVLVADPDPAGMAAAVASGPSVALVGCGVLAHLPSGWTIPLIAVGDDDRPDDIKAALATGARSLLAWPDGAADLPGELARVAATGPPSAGEGAGGLVVAARGVQGGAGTTTVAIHLAAAWARWGPAPVLLADLAGGLAFRLDLGAAPTWSTLIPPAGPGPLQATSSGPPGAADPAEGPPYEAPGGSPGPADPADGLLRPPGPGSAVTGWSLDAGTLVGSVIEPWAGLAVLPLAGLADGVPDPPPDPWSVEVVLELARTAYRLVVVDLPAADGPAVRTALALADALVAVGRCETAGVRGLQTALEAWAASGRDPDTAGAVVTGVRPQAPLAPREVRAVLGDRLWGLIPAAAAELAAGAEDGVLLIDRHDLPAVQAMLALANRVVPFAAVSA
jgi:cellulose biosynthesis protein BcsQ